METVRQWLGRKDIRQVRAVPLDDVLSEKFFRDPMRPLHYTSALFYSPADGFVLYSRIVRPYERIVEVKGRNLTARELLQDETYSPISLVVGIFLTLYDVHIQRLPTDGYVHFRRPSALGSETMVPVEDAILKGRQVNMNDLGYAFANERVVTRVYCPWLRQIYYLVQIADREVDMITLLPQEGDYLRQGERFGQIRFGSQVDLIIPLTNPRYDLTSLVGDKVLYHIEAGTDPIVKVTVR